MRRVIQRFSYAFCLLMVGSFGFPAFADSSSDLASKLREMKVNLVAFGSGGMIDDYPHWSPDSRKLAFNFDGGWQELELASLILSEAKWGGQSIAYVTDATVATRISEDLLSSYIANKDSSASEVTLENGSKISMASSGMGTTLTIQRVDATAEAVFKTDIDTCFGPTPSPDGKFVAFICDGAGLFLTLVD